MTSTGTLWGNGTFEIALSWSDTMPVAITRLATADPRDQPPVSVSLRLERQPLVEILAVGHGRARASLRSVETAVGRRLRYRRHDITNDGASLCVEQADDLTGLVVSSYLTSGSALGFATRTSVTNAGDGSMVLQGVSSLTMALLRGSDAPAIDDLVLHSGISEWLGENRWTPVPVRLHDMVDLGLPLHGQD